MSEFIIENEEFNIRKVMDCDYGSLGDIAEAEYVFGSMYGIDPELAIVIAKKYQGQGYGVRILESWLPWVKGELGYR